MLQHRLLLTVAVMILPAVVMLVGCNNDSADKKTTTNTNSANSFSVDEPLLQFDPDIEFPPVDNGRLAIKVPKDWKEISDKKSYLMAFRKRDSNAAYPVLIVEKPKDADGITELDSDETKKKFLADLIKEVTKVFGSALKAKPKYVTINNHLLAQYRVVQQTSSGGTIESIYLTTISKGRQYNLVLRSEKGKSAKDWPVLLTMASGLSFPSGAGENVPPKIDFSVVGEKQNVDFDEGADSPKSAKSKTDDQPAKKSDEPGGFDEK